MSSTNESQQGNISVERAFSIIEHLALKPNGATLVDISKDLDIPKSTAFRLLETMKQKGYVRTQDHMERYFIGFMTINVGMQGLANLDIFDVAVHYLRDIAETTGETAFLGVHNEGQVVYLYKVEGTYSILMNSRLGSVRPVHCTGLGKAMLSGMSMERVDQIVQEKGMKQFTKNTLTTPVQLHEELAKIRLDGFAMDNEELEEGLGCYAVPIYNYTGQAVAAICLSGPIDRIKENREDYSQKIKEAGHTISKQLGFVSSMKK